MVMILRNFILIVSIICIFSLSAFAQTVEQEQNPSNIGSPPSQTANPTALQGASSQDQPASPAAQLPQPQNAVPAGQQAPDTQLNQSGAFPGQPALPQGNQPPKPVNAPVVRSAIRAPLAVGGGSIGGGAISLNFDDADIYSVIQTVFSEILKFSYIIDPRVKG
ncbi:MAG: hypothetical protein ACXWMO_10795, partial [Syntrophales bacterium]